MADHSEWRVTANPVAGKMLYGVYRLKDKDAELMAKCNGGEISREECEARLSMKN